DFSIDVARRATDRLNQRGRVAEIAFLIGIENADQRYLGQIETFAQEIDADEYVEDAEAQIAQNRDAFEGIDFAVQIAYLQAVLDEKVRQVFGHFFSERR